MSKQIKLIKYVIKQKRRFCNEKNIKKQKRYNPVALVVTIIILLILAGISIATLTGSGLFENARLAEQKSKAEQEKEEGILGDYENKIAEYIDSSRDTITISKEELESLINQKITERLTTQPLLDYENKVDISSYTESNNQYTCPKNGIIQVFGLGVTSGGWVYVNVNDVRVSCLQSTNEHDAYSTIVNKNDAIYFFSGSWNMVAAYFVPFK